MQRALCRPWSRCYWNLPNLHKISHANSPSTSRANLQFTNPGTFRFGRKKDSRRAPDGVSLQQRRPRPPHTPSGINGHLARHVSLGRELHDRPQRTHRHRWNRRTGQGCGDGYPARITCIPHPFRGIHLRGLEEVERKTGAEGLSIVDDVAWVATGNDVKEVTAKLEACAVAAGEWAQANAASFDEGKTEAVLFRKGREGMPARKIQVGNLQHGGNTVAGGVSVSPVSLG